MQFKVKMDTPVKAVMFHIVFHIILRTIHDFAISHSTQPEPPLHKLLVFYSSFNCISKNIWKMSTEQQQQDEIQYEFKDRESGEPEAHKETPTETPPQQKFERIRRWGRKAKNVSLFILSPILLPCKYIYDKGEAMFGIHTLEKETPVYYKEKRKEDGKEESKYIRREKKQLALKLLPLEVKPEKAKQPTSGQKMKTKAGAGDPLNCCLTTAHLKPAVSAHGSATVALPKPKSRIVYSSSMRSKFNRRDQDGAGDGAGADIPARETRANNEVESSGDQGVKDRTLPSREKFTVQNHHVSGRSFPDRAESKNDHRPSTNFRTQQSNRQNRRRMRTPTNCGSIDTLKIEQTMRWINRKKPSFVRQRAVTLMSRIRPTRKLIG